MKPTSPSRPWPLIAALAIAAAAILAAPATEADPRCRGTKQWYAGKCRYPDDIAKMKAEEAGRRAGEQRHKAEADAAARRQAEQARLRDIDDCGQARQADTVDAWKAYLAQQPNGFCRKEAERRVAELPQQGEQPAAPPAPGPGPTPAPSVPAAPALPPPAAAPHAPPPPPAPHPAEDQGVSALVVGGAASLGVGLAAATVGVVFVAKAASAKADFDASPNADSADQQESSALLADIFIPVGAVAGVAGAVLLGLGLAAPDDAAEQRAAVPKLTPCAGPAGVLVAATWRF
ncbi:MAG: hypothetical protein HY744_33665 [Deltaproteobacteria bacterium]|nr:hypothetical protein [Deltaproteobacteria bacterium]